MAKFTVHLNNQDIDLEVTRQGNQLRVVNDGRSATVEIVHAEGSAVLLEHVRPDGTRRRIRLAGHVGPGDQRQVWVNGRVLSYRRVRQRGGSSQDGEGSLAASIPAVVTAVLVQPGDKVAEGDKLILLESMKMVIPILAPYAGVVASVSCQPGESVQAGVPLIELKELESGD
ncbi:MAG: biotin/lipoyl-binding protein [Ardenticatenaceae bacterium]|nr:biotin/lipoyl-binding protein [Ardenticatenaceae bacterium]MCB8987938.1 biotin/lipoyl-binding protein [Ardenticatenaceae bacterium]